MFTPEGQPAEKIDKIMLLSMWAKALKNERAQIENSLQAVKKIITAGMGKPTLPISMHTITFLLFYWKYMEEIVKKAMTNLEKLEDEVAIDYGHPQGDIKARETMAKAMTDWYGVKINPEEILFTSGGAGGLRVVFDTLYGRYKQIPNYRIITPFPHYTLYSDYPHHRLHPVDVMKEPGYRLTAEALEKSIQEAYELAQKDGGLPKAVLICNPNNPLGTVISEEEFKKIAQVLRKYPDLHIILDEAYTEMTYVDVPSFYKIAPDLKNRTTVMRSGTKGLSMAGERVAMLLNSDKKFMSELLATNISLCGHAPRSLQMAYAYTMDKLDLDEKNKLRTFYKSKVDYVSERVREMGATMPDAGYKVEGTFYVLADFSDMLGLEIDAEAKRALGETGVISTDEELAYNLLFKDSVMIAPLSYYGTSAEAGIMRITCSDNKEQLCELMDRLESTLLAARTKKQANLLTRIKTRLPQIEKIQPHEFKKISVDLDTIINTLTDCAGLRLQIKKLTDIDSLIDKILETHLTNSPSVEKNGIKPGFFNKKLEEKEEQKEEISENDSNYIQSEEQQELETLFIQFLDTNFEEGSLLRKIFEAASKEERLKFKPWKEHLEANHSQTMKVF